MKCSYTIEMGEPIIVSQAPLDEEDYIGKWCFPSLEFMPDGGILAGFHVGADRSEDQGKQRGHCISYDNGLTWKEYQGPDFSWAGQNLLLPNGDRIRSKDLKCIDISKYNLKPINRRTIPGLNI